MQKAADDMRKQQEQAAEEKAKAIDERVPKLELSGLDQSQCSIQQHQWCRARGGAKNNSSSSKFFGCRTIVTVVGKNLLLSKLFCPTMQNLGLKPYFGEYLSAKLELWAPVIFSVGNLEPFVENLQRVSKSRFIASLPEITQQVA